jgi:hypothetical protein
MKNGDILELNLNQFRLWKDIQIIYL